MDTLDLARTKAMFDELDSIMKEAGAAGSIKKFLKKGKEEGFIFLKPQHRAKTGPTEVFGKQQRKQAGLLTPRFMGQAPSKTQKALQSVARKFGWKEKPYVKKFAPGSKSLNKADVMGYRAKDKEKFRRMAETHKELTGQ